MAAEATRTAAAGMKRTAATDSGWEIMIDGRTHPVALPYARKAAEKSRPLGADTDAEIKAARERPNRRG